MDVKLKAITRRKDSTPKDAVEQGCSFDMLQNPSGDLSIIRISNAATNPAFPSTTTPTS